MPEFTKSPPALVERFDSIAAEYPQAQRRPTFGYPCLYVGGNMVSGLFQSSWHVRLGPAETAELLAIEGAAPFEPMPGRPMTGFTLLAAVDRRGRRGDPPLGRARDRLRRDDAAEGAEAEEDGRLEGRLRATACGPASWRRVQRGGRRERAESAVEREPAQLVAQSLVVEHELPDLVGESGALPSALQAAGRHAFVFRRCRPLGPDRVGRCPELVGRDMAHRGGLAGSIRGMPCRPTQVPGRRVRMAGGRAGLCPPDLTARPDTSEVDRPAWPVVVRPCRLEMVQHVLRAVRGPDREKTMIVVLERPAATHRDEPRIPDLGEDHQSAIPFLCPRRVARPAEAPDAATPRPRWGDGVGRRL